MIDFRQNTQICQRQILAPALHSLNAQHEAGADGKNPRGTADACIQYPHRVRMVETVLVVHPGAGCVFIGDGFAFSKMQTRRFTRWYIALI